MHIWNKFRIFAVIKIRNHLNIMTMKTYSFMGKQCAIHIPENKKEAVKKLQQQGEAANMRNVYLIRKGVY